MNKMDKYLLENLTRLAETGYKDENPRAKYKDGTPAHSLSIRGSVWERYDLSKGEFPITETRPIPIKNAIEEIDLIYTKPTNKLEDFHDKGIMYWDEWDIGDGTIGNRYGYTVAKYDLMNKLLDGLVNNPFGKRHIMDLYQYSDLESSPGLHPCAFMTKWSVSKVNGELYLDMTLTQRSSDYLVAGTGINQIQYVALQMKVAKHCGYKLGLFEHERKNVHIYDRHLPQLEETINRLMLLQLHEDKPNPQLVLNVPDGTNFYEITNDKFELINYEPIKPQLKFELAI